MYAVVQLDALSELERSADEPLAPEDAPPPPPSLRDRPSPAPEADGSRTAPTSLSTMSSAAPIAATPSAPSAPPAEPATPNRRESTWTGADVAVMLAALLVLALSVAGLIWLLKG